MAKITVQIMRNTCCLNMVFNFTKSKLGSDLFARMYTRSVVALLDNFADGFFQENDAHVYDVAAN